MKLKELVLGFIIGLATSIVGASLYLWKYTEYNLFADYNTLKNIGILSPVLKLGAILNIGVFFILLKYNKDAIAKGIILTLLTLTALAFFI